MDGEESIGLELSCADLLARSNLCEHGVIIEIAEGRGAFATWAERDDTVDLPDVRFRTLKQKTTAAVAVANSRAVGPAGTEGRVSQVLAKLGRLVLTAHLRRYLRELGVVLQDEQLTH